jgi:SAM-dependent methyltransferase
MTVKKEPFLELGASAVPHSKATHAVDLDSKQKTMQFANTLYREEGDTTPEKFERRLKSMDYRFGFNYNTQRFPWPNESFKTVYSSGSLGHYGNPQNAFKEAYRVLKHNGKLIIDQFGGSEPQMINLRRMIINTGFKNISIKLSKEVSMYKGEKNYSGKLTATKP